MSTNKGDKALLSVELGKYVIKSAPAERALSKEIAGSIFTPEFWAVLRQSPRVTLQLVRPNGLLKDLGKGFAKGLGVGVIQMLFNKEINSIEKSIEERNEELERCLKQQSTTTGNIVAYNI